jgi:hypothetical protein
MKTVPAIVGACLIALPAAAQPFYGYRPGPVYVPSAPAPVYVPPPAPPVYSPPTYASPMGPAGTTFTPNRLPGQTPVGCAWRGDCN